ncbi:MAG: AraC family transcriptional regulator [Hyphomonas sp.]|uniref:AraC family transcriptional regulator n=1 Tax=Hyphomonas sp. TaxID=87 RepID=UPI0025C43B01|nr:AraC family transcriptional regulator [Hyphomonas sp.]MBA4339833.1 AraC family transcriptional regulator [Hyphomonas sp.]
MTKATVSASIVRGLAVFAEGKGADPAALYLDAGLDPASLEDGDTRIPLARYQALMRAAQAATGEPALGLLYGEAIDMADVSLVGLIMNASATMGEAFAQMQRFGALAVELESAPGQPRFELAERSSQLWMTDTRPAPNDFPELTEAAFARLVCGPRRFLPAPHVLEVHVTHPAPSYRAEYTRIFKCPVTFSADWNAMRLAPGLTSWPVAQQPAYVFGILTERADALLQDLAAARTLRSQVEAKLLARLHTGDITGDAIAAALGISRQTLFRRLKTEGTSFKLVLDDLRRRMALDYLGARKTSVNETAYLVGFSDAPAFSRAFKRWTGKSPKAVRAEARSAQTVA